MAIFGIPVENLKPIPTTRDPRRKPPGPLPRWTVEYRRGRYLVLDGRAVVATCSDLLTAEGLASELIRRGDQVTR